MATVKQIFNNHNKYGEQWDIFQTEQFDVSVKVGHNIYEVLDCFKNKSIHRLKCSEYHFDDIFRTPSTVRTQVQNLYILLNRAKTRKKSFPHNITFMKDISYLSVL